jgi:electron transport complex protein RnfE
MLLAVKYLIDEKMKARRARESATAVAGNAEKA